MTSLPLVETLDVTYGSSNGRDLHLDILRPDVPLHPLRPAMLWVHGGGWAGGERQSSPNAFLADRGFVTATMSYRFSDEAIFPAQIHDVKTAIRYLRATAEEWGIDPERIGIWGHSAGGHLAALAAVSEGISSLEGDGGSADESSAVQAAVAMSPPTDFLVEWFATSDYPPHPEVEVVVSALLGGDDLSDPEIADRARFASPNRLVHPETPPVLVVHGTLDDLVPVEQGHLLVNSLLEVGVDASMLELPHDDHGLASVWGSEVDAHVIMPAMIQIFEFLERTLGPVELNER